MGLEVVDVDQLPTHGGSIRVWLAHKGVVLPTSSVHHLLEAEDRAGLDSLDAYSDFQQRADRAKYSLIDFLRLSSEQGRRIIGYGAAAKGNTLLNYAGIKSDLLPAVVDRAPSKQGRYLPGSHIPIVGPDQLVLDSPESMLVLPWN